MTSPGSGSPNRLLYTGFMNGGTNPNNPSVTNPGNRSTAVGQPVEPADAGRPAAPRRTPGAPPVYPPGLSIGASTGLITGSPTTVGTSNVTVTVTDSASRTGTANFTWTVTTGGGGCNPVQVVGNSGLENGSTPWSANSGRDRRLVGLRVPGATPAPVAPGSAVRADAHRLRLPVGDHPGRVHQRHPALLGADHTAEYDGQVYDRLTVTMGSTTVATATNLDPNCGYVEKVVDVSQFAGQTVTLKFTGVEDRSLQTSFVIDDVTINAS